MKNVIKNNPIFQSFFYEKTKNPQFWVFIKFIWAQSWRVFLIFIGLFMTIFLVTWTLSLLNIISVDHLTIMIDMASNRSIISGIIIEILFFPICLYIFKLVSNKNYTTFKVVWQENPGKSIWHKHYLMPLLIQWFFSFVLLVMEKIFDINLFGVFVLSLVTSYLMFTFKVMPFSLEAKKYEVILAE